VRLTLFQNLIDYIQSRGRARHEESRYIVFLEEGNEEKRRHYLKTVEKEEEMNQALVERGEIEDDDSEAYLLLPEEIYIHPTSGARLTVINSTSILRRYCGMMPKDEFTQSEVCVSIVLMLSPCI
jgi:endoribonuclease Dicer